MIVIVLCLISIIGLRVIAVVVIAVIYVVIIVSVVAGLIVVAVRVTTVVAVFKCIVSLLVESFLVLKKICSIRLNMFRITSFLIFVLNYSYFCCDRVNDKWNVFQH